MKKEENIKEKFKQALISTVKAISEDFDNKKILDKENNSSKNYWMPVVNSPYTGYTEFQRSGGAGTSISSYIWRTSDGTISCRRSDNTHGTINLGVPYAGPLIITSGRQSPMMTEIVGVWDAKRGDQHANRDRWYK